MSPVTPSSPLARLSARTQNYCCRADSLAQDPSLTMEGAAKALDHLAALQRDITALRLQQGAGILLKQRRMEAPFKQMEAALQAARETLSHALLGAVPDAANLYGPRRHGPAVQLTSRELQQNAVVEHFSATKPAPPEPPQAVSASRALLDLEALRPYLNDAALREALERYSKDTGACDVTGVAYAVLPASAHLPCAIY